MNLAALQAGKHVYCEKPFADDPAAGAEVLAAARERGLRVGCAPDTFLGAGHQTVRALLDAGRIGRVVAASAIVMGHGPEGWHSNPAFFYAPGGGPHFDLGPYFLTALVHALGPVRAVTAMAGRAFETRTVGSGPNEGAVVPVQVNTHLSGTLEFASGCIGTIAMSFDVWQHGHPGLELYGTAGSISAPDPNGFGGPVAVADPGQRVGRGAVVRRPDRGRPQQRPGRPVHRPAHRSSAPLQRRAGAARPGGPGRPGPVRRGARPGRDRVPPRPPCPARGGLDLSNLAYGNTSARAWRTKNSLHRSQSNGASMRGSGSASASSK